MSRVERPEVVRETLRRQDELSRESRKRGPASALNRIMDQLMEIEMLLSSPPPVSEAETLETVIGILAATRHETMAIRDELQRQDVADTEQHDLLSEIAGHMHDAAESIREQNSYAGEWDSADAAEDYMYLTRYRNQLLALADRCLPGVEPVHAPTCERCGAELTTGLMAVACERGAQCEFYPEDADGQAFIAELRGGHHRPDEGARP